MFQTILGFRFLSRVRVAFGFRGMQGFLAILGCKVMQKLRVRLLCNVGVT